MAYVLKALGSSDISLQDDSVIPRGAPLTVNYLTKAALSAIAAGLISCTPAAPSLTPTSAVTLTNSTGGTAATITAGTATVAAVVDVASAANAISTLTAQVNKLTVDVATLLSIIIVVSPEIAAIYQVDNLTQNY